MRLTLTRVMVCQAESLLLDEPVMMILICTLSRAGMDRRVVFLF
jgi:hypothetical protein